MSPVDDWRERTVVRHADGRRRCAWCGTDPLYVHYHDTEWGVPVHDDRRHYEFLVLDAMQAGLSWRTVLHKRANLPARVCGFDPEKVARFRARDVRELLNDAGIIRNRLSLRSWPPRR